MSLSTLKTCEITKTKFSYVRVFDSFNSIFEQNDNSEKNNQIGELRVKIYLEDFGPIDLISFNEQKTQQDIEAKNILANLKLEEARKNQPISQNEQEVIDMQTSLEELEMKVVWELENWKKAEESKFLFGLKQKEIDFLLKLSEDWKKKEFEKDKMFKNHESSLISIESRLKTKALELQKREARIVLLENEFKVKIEETSREIMKKNDEIKSIKNEHVDISKRHSNLVKNMEKQIANLSANIVLKEKEIMGLKKDFESSPISKLKREIVEKNDIIERNIIDLKNNEQLKMEYKEYINDLQAEINRFRLENENLKGKSNLENIQSIDAMKLQLYGILKNKPDESVDNFRKELAFIRGDKINENGVFKDKQRDVVKRQTFEKNDNPLLSEMLAERNLLLDMGLNNDDILIQEMEREIEKFN